MQYAVASSSSFNLFSFACCFDFSYSNEYLCSGINGTAGFVFFFPYLTMLNQVLRVVDGQCATGGRVETRSREISEPGV